MWSKIRFEQKVGVCKGVANETRDEGGKQTEKEMVTKLIEVYIYIYRGKMHALHGYDLVLVHGIRWSKVLEKLRMTFQRIQCMKK